MVALWMLHAIATSLVIGSVAELAQRAARLLGKPTRWIWVGAILLSVTLPLSSLLPRVSSETDSPRFSQTDEGPAGDAPVASAVATSPSVASANAALGLGDLYRRVGNALEGWTHLLLVGWISASGVLLVLLALFHFGLGRVRRGWRRDTLDGRPVLLSSSIGPAVCGSLRPEVVLPDWVFELGDDARRLILEHEDQHLRARDPLMLHLLNLAAVIFPWNPLVWWQLSRLRLAVEVDCDERVLRDPSVDVHRYGQLLLEVGYRRSVPVFSLPGFAIRLGALEERIESISLRFREGRRSAAVPYLVGAALLATTLGFVPAPERPPELMSILAIGTPRAIEDRSSGPDSAALPSFDLPTDIEATEFDRAPVLRNRDEVWDALSQEAERLFQSGVEGGRSEVALLVDPSGEVRRAELPLESGLSDLLESAMLRTARTMRFSPALLDNAPTWAWIAVPLMIEREDSSGSTAPSVGVPAGSNAGAGSGSESASEGAGWDERREVIDADPFARIRYALEALSSAGRSDSGLEERALAPVPTASLVATLLEPNPIRPAFDRLSMNPQSNEDDPRSDPPHSVAPILRNADEIDAVLRSVYPSNLKGRRIGGTVRLLVYVDAEGRADRSFLRASSGHPRLDQVAARAAERMRFIPARSGDRTVGVWVDVPISFTARAP